MPLKYRFSILLLSLACTGCRQQQSSYPALPLPADTPGIAIQLDSFPLRTGYSWTYTAVYQHANNAAITYSYTTTIIADTFVRHLHFFKVLYTDRSTIDTYYLVNGPAGLYQLTPAALSEADSAHVFDSLNLLIRYPARVGDTWSYITGGSYDFTKSWQGYVHVTTPAGAFDCVKMAYSDFTGTDTFYYSAKGFIMEKTANATINNTHAASVIKLNSVNF